MYSIVKRGQVYQPAVSGNGKVIAWRDLPKPGVSEIGIQREGEEPTLLTNDRVAVQSPKLNYDGSVVAYERHGGKDWDWDIARKVGEAPAEVVIDTDGKSADFDISSDGKKIVSDYWPRHAPRVRNVSLWTEGEGVKQLSPPDRSSGLPEISGDGERVFYLRLPETPRQPNEIWMQEADGSEKPVVYEPGQNPEANHKSHFDTNEDGSVLVWAEKVGVADAKIMRWDLQHGIKEKVDEAPLAGQVQISGDGSTMAWVSNERNEQGEWVSQLHWKRGEEEKLVSSDTLGGYSSPSLSDDGKTLVWMWKHPNTLYDHEIRKAVFE